MMQEVGELWGVGMSIVAPLEKLGVHRATFYHRKG
jgi:hypothetical protein